MKGEAMRLFEKYTSQTIIHVGRFFTVFRAHHQGKKYILKVLATESDHLSHYVQLKKEFEIFQSLSKGSNRFLTPVEFFRVNKDIAIVWEDQELVPLSQYVEKQEGALSAERFLDIAVQITEGLHHIHNNGILHRDVSSANILINPNTYQTFIIDFSCSTHWREYDDNLLAARQGGPCCGTFQYMSPEHTGKIQRPIDNRSDLYSLGIVLYELLTSKTPFTALSSKVSVLFAHVAFQIPPVHLLQNSKVPSVIGHILDRLLQKDAEHRYQSALGVLYDLNQARSHLSVFPDESLQLFEPIHLLEAEGSPKRIEKQLTEIVQRHSTLKRDQSPIELGKQDFCSFLSTVFNLYGRESEIQKIVSVYEQIKNNSQTVPIFISGSSGVGKTFLATHTFRLIANEFTNERALSIDATLIGKGKFSEYNQSVPYFGLGVLFQNLLQNSVQLFGSAVVRQKLIDELGDVYLNILGDVLVPVLKEYCLSVTLVDLSPQDSQQRLVGAMCEFIKTLSQLYKSNMVHLFLDDVQWADEHSIYVIKQLLQHPDIVFLAILAYRDTKVQEGYPVKALLKTLEEERMDLVELHLDSLSKQDVGNMCSDILHAPPDRLESLISLVFDRTGGNPFFVSQLVNSLFYSDSLKFNFDTFQWNIVDENVKKLPDSKNVVDLLVHEIKLLEAKSREILVKASFLGHQFDLQTLTVITQLSGQEVSMLLVHALNQGLIQPESFDSLSISELLESVSIQEPEEQSSCRVYQFLHDRVHESFYSFVKEEDRPQLHMNIAALLLNDRTVEQLNSTQLFLIVEHLNFGESCIHGGALLKTQIDLNLKACLLAKASGGLTQAMSCVKFGLSALHRLSSNPWEECHDDTMEFYRNLCELHYMNKQYNLAEETFTLVVEKSNSSVERIEMMRLMTSLYCSSSSFEKAYSQAMATFREMGLDFPTPTAELFHQRMTKLRTLLNGRPILDVMKELPIVHDRELTVFENLLADIVPIATVSQNTELYVNLPVFAILYFLEKGMIQEQSLGLLSVLGVGLQVMNGPSNESIEFSKAGHTMAGGLQLYPRNVSSAALHSGMCSLFYTNLQQSTEYFERSFTEAQRSNDTSLIEYSTIYSCWAQIALSCPLEKIIEFYKQKIKYLTLMKCGVAMRVLQPFFDLIQQLITGETEVTIEGIPRYSAEELKSHMDSPFLRSFWLDKIRATYIMGDNAGLSSALEKFVPSLELSRGFITEFEYYFWGPLARIRLHKPDSESTSELLKFIDLCLEKLESYKTLYAHNFEAKYLLIKAERFRLESKEDGDPSQLLELYDQVLDKVEQTEQFVVGGIVAEIAAAFCLSKQLKFPAKSYTDIASALYSLWGATAKSEQLNSSKAFKSFSLTRASTSISSTDSSDTFSASESDSASNIVLTHATQILTGEGNSRKIVKVICTILAQHAGADRGFMFFLEGEELYLLARWGPDHKLKVYPLPQEIPKNTFDDDAATVETRPVLGSQVSDVVPYGLITQVASSGNLFSNTFHSDENVDQYLQHSDAKSVCCLPMKHLGAVMGVVYLENTLTIGAFTDKQQTMLEHLAGQISASIERTHLNIHLQYTLDEVQKQNEMLLQLDRMKDDFVATTSHELRTPLNAILGFTDILREAKLTPEQKQYCDLIYTSAEGLLSVINDILDFRRFKHDSVKLSVDRFELRNCLDEVIRLLTITSRSTEPLIHLDISLTNEATWIEGDRVRLQQVLLKLLSNAFKFTQSGDVILRAAEIKDPSKLAKLQLQDPSQQVQEIVIHFEIQDTGIGIPDEKRKNLFQPFSQLDSGANRNYQGTGLGLTISQNIVRALSSDRSTIDFVSTVGKGSTFFFDVPFKVVSEPSQQEHAAASSTGVNTYPLSVLPGGAPGGASEETLAAIKRVLDGCVLIVVTQNTFTYQSFVHNLFRYNSAFTQVSSLDEARAAKRNDNHPSSSSRRIVYCVDSSVLSESQVADLSAKPDSAVATLFPNGLGENEFLGLILHFNQRAQIKNEPSLDKFCLLAKPFCSNHSAVSISSMILTHEYKHAPPPAAVAVVVKEEPSVAVGGGAADSAVAKPALASNKDGASAAAATETPAAPTLSNVRILMVEDNTMNQRVQQKLIQMLGAECEIAANGKIGLDKFISSVSNLAYDMIIMDCHMPEMDGFESTQEIRKYEVANNLPHIHILGLTAGSAFEDCIASGMCSVMSKPVRKVTFHNEILKYLALSACSTPGTLVVQ